MTHDGRNERRLTVSAGDDLEPDWSPRGTDVVFVSNRDGNEEIYVMKADGSDPRRLTNYPGPDIEPAWTSNVRQPTGETDATTSIAYVSTIDGNDDIFIISPDGSGQSRLTTEPANDYSPRWSPDGSRLVFVSDRDGNEEIYVMNADGSGQARLTDSPARDAAPRWSADGATIDFRSDRDGSMMSYSMRPDGNGQVRSEQQTPG